VTSTFTPAAPDRDFFKKANGARTYAGDIIEAGGKREEESQQSESRGKKDYVVVVRERSVGVLRPECHQRSRATAWLGNRIRCAFELFERVAELWAAESESKYLKVRRHLFVSNRPR